MPAVKRTRSERQALAARKKRAFRQKMAWKARYNQNQKGSNGIKSSTLTLPPRSLTPSYGGPFGQTFETEMNYAEYFSLDPSSGGSSSYIFRANGCYDPNQTGTGHQPHGFNELSVLYENYQVLSSTIEAVLFPGNTTTAIVSGTGQVIPEIMGSVFAVAVRDTTTSLTGLLVTMTDILERPNIITKYVNSNSDPVTIRSSFSMPKWYGRTRDLNDEEVTGTANSDPTDQVLYHIILAANNGSFNLPGHQVNVRIKYKVRWFNPKNLPQST